MSRPFQNPVSSISSEPSHSTAEFSPDLRTLLLRIAHEAISSALVARPTDPGRAPLEFQPAQLPASLLVERGVFTTLYLQGELRGCVGYASALRPLARAVAETARAAAFEDSRFWPVGAEEAAELKISLSVLSPLIAIDPSQVEIGRHGLVITQGMRRGLLLPQVAVERGWDRETFLGQTCRKAGLPADAWRADSATIEAFTAEVFGDDGCL
jgi:AmmeMemoRadiSam system protein A